MAIQLYHNPHGKCQYELSEVVKPTLHDLFQPFYLIRHLSLPRLRLAHLVKTGPAGLAVGVFGSEVILNLDIEVTLVLLIGAVM